MIERPWELPLCRLKRVPAKNPSATHALVLRHDVPRPPGRPPQTMGNSTAAPWKMEFHDELPYKSRARDVALR
jgi:hypothetical protein